MVAVILLAVAPVAGTLLVLLPILLQASPFIMVYYVSSHILNTRPGYSNVSGAEYGAGLVIEQRTL